MRCEEPVVALSGDPAGEIAVSGTDRRCRELGDLCCLLVRERCPERGDANERSTRCDGDGDMASRGPSTTTGIDPSAMYSSDRPNNCAPLWKAMVSGVLRYFGPALASSMRSGWRRPTKPRTWPREMTRRTAQSRDLCCAVRNSYPVTSRTESEVFGADRCSDHPLGAILYPPALVILAWLLQRREIPRDCRVNWMPRQWIWTRQLRAYVRCLDGHEGRVSTCHPINLGCRPSLE